MRLRSWRVGSARPVGSTVSAARGESPAGPRLQPEFHHGLLGAIVWMTTLVAICAAVSLHAQQVSFERILRADREPQNWLTYSGGVYSQRYSGLTQITLANVRNLELQWVFQTRGPAEPTEKFEATPLVVDGVMYTVLAPNHVVALDAATGRLFWMYSPT